MVLQGLYKGAHRIAGAWITNLCESCEAATVIQNWIMPPALVLSVGRVAWCAAWAGALVPSVAT